MISAQGVSLQFGGRPLFQNVDIQFTPGNCYGLIGESKFHLSSFTYLHQFSNPIINTFGICIDHDNHGGSCKLPPVPIHIEFFWKFLPYPLFG